MRAIPARRSAMPIQPVSKAMRFQNVSDRSSAIMEPPTWWSSIMGLPVN